MKQILRFSNIHFPITNYFITDSKPTRPFKRTKKKEKFLQHEQV
uniref:Uncharacterized protein n=1 Tax=Rhizophora mucronata TaxID=61149 RepID=A0A2P2R474_RHIMU